VHLLLFLLYPTIAQLISQQYHTPDQNTKNHQQGIVYAAINTLLAQETMTSSRFYCKHDQI